MHIIIVGSVKNSIVCLSIDCIHLNGNNLLILVEMIDLSVYGSLRDLLYTIQPFCSTVIALLIASFYVMLNI